MVNPQFSTKNGPHKSTMNPPPIKLTVNEQTVCVEHDATIADLLLQLKMGGGSVAVEVNLEIVPKTEHESFRLSQNDQLEIVSLASGG